MKLWLSLLAGLATWINTGNAGQESLTFKAAQTAGHYQFDTGQLRGQIRLNGKSQGLIELIHVPTGAAVAQGGGLPGLFSYYRIFSRGKRFGDAARDWPTTNRILADGALEVHWPSGPEHPLEMTAIYRWSDPRTLDLETQVKPLQDMPDFEVFLSSYFAEGFKGLVYVKPNFFAGGNASFLPADVNPLVDGTYLMFPRDQESIRKIFDGRWDLPPNPVQWSITRWLAGPVGMRRNSAQGITALIMAPPTDCFAVSLPYNKTPPDGVAGHQSLYLSLFGGDVAAGQIVKARSRLVVAQDLSDVQAGELYQRFLKLSPANP